MSLLYHEKQVAGLCGVHALNTLLQGRYFTELDLAEIARELDALERAMLAEEPGGLQALGEHGNLDDSGMFSVQVLSKALEVWGLSALPIDGGEVRATAGGFDPSQEAGFICNLEEHWFTVRHVEGQWYNFNSLLPAPEALSSFHLAAFLGSLRDQGYIIFVVRGQLPAPSGSTGDRAGQPHTAAAGCSGAWLTPDDAAAAIAGAAAARQRGRAANVVEGVFARAAAAGGAISLRSHRMPGTGTMGRPAGSADGRYEGGEWMDAREDADLAAAIAASLGEEGTSPLVGGDTVVQERGPAATGAGDGGRGQLGAGAHEEEDDPELAMALAASLEEHQRGQQERQEQQKQQQQQQHDLHVPANGDAETPVEVGAASGEPGVVMQGVCAEAPEEPPEGAEGALMLALRLPSGARVARRFRSTDTVGQLYAFAVQCLQTSAGGDWGSVSMQGLVLSTAFPHKELHEMEQDLAGAGLAGAMVTVALSSLVCK